MVRRNPMLDAVTAVVTTRSTGRIRLELEHPVLDVARAEMTPSQALELARSLIASASLQATVAGALIAQDAGAGGQSVASPRRLQSGRVNWEVMGMLGALAGVWGAVAIAAAHWAGWFQ